MDEALADWLGRFDAEALEPKFRARGLTTVEEVCAAKLSADDLIALGVEPLWRRSSVLSGIAEANRDKKAMADEGWADFGDGGGGGGATGQESLLSFADAAGTPAPAPAGGLIDLLGGDSFTTQEQSPPKFQLSFNVVEASPESKSKSPPKGSGMVDLFMGDNGPSTSAAQPHYRVVCKAMVSSGFAKDSSPLGGLEVGDVFRPQEERLNEQGIARVRFGGGWVSKVASDGTCLLEPTSDPVTTTVATTTLAVSPQPLRLEPTVSTSSRDADRHADALLSGIDDLLAELGEDESPTDYSLKGQTGFSPPGFGGGSPSPTGRSPPRIGGSSPGRGGSPGGLGSPPGVGSPDLIGGFGGEFTDTLGRIVTDTANLTVGVVRGSTQAVRALDGKLGGHGEHAAQVLDQRLAVSQTAHLVSESAHEKAARLKEFDESHHLTSTVATVGKEGVRKGLTLSKAGVEKAAPVAEKVGHFSAEGLSTTKQLTMDGIDLTKEQLRALRDRIVALRNGGRLADEEKANRLLQLETMFRRSPRAAAAALAEGVDEWMTAGSSGGDSGGGGAEGSPSPGGGGGQMSPPGLGEVPQSKAARPAGDQQYDYGSYGGVSLEEATGEPSSGGQEESSRGPAGDQEYDYGSYGGVSLEECMAGVDELTEAELDAQEAAQRFGVVVQEEVEDTEEMRLAAAVERRVAEQAAREEQQRAAASAASSATQFGDLLDVGGGGGGGGGGGDDGFASWGDDSPGGGGGGGQPAVAQPTEMGLFLASFGAEDSELAFAARGYSTVASLAAAQLSESELQALGVRGYGVKGMVSALRNQLQKDQQQQQQPAGDLFDVGAAPAPAAPAPAPAPAGGGGLLDVLEWS
jgi:hypothetical protein